MWILTTLAITGATILLALLWKMVTKETPEPELDAIVDLYLAVRQMTYSDALEEARQLLMRDGLFTVETSTDAFVYRDLDASISEFFSKYSLVQLTESEVTLSKQEIEAPLDHPSFVKIGEQGHDGNFLLVKPLQPSVYLASQLVGDFVSEEAFYPSVYHIIVYHGRGVTEDIL